MTSLVVDSFYHRDDAASYSSSICGVSLTDDELVSRAALRPGEYEHIVATLSMQRLRRALAGRVAPANGEAQRFDDAIRAKLTVSPLGRLEERIQLRRAIGNALIDDELEPMVRNDAFTWLQALKELALRNIDLTGGIPQELEGQFVSRKVAEVLRGLQMAVRQERQGNRDTFERAAYELFAGEFPLAPLVVMEGFTFLTPLQRRFVNRAIERGRDVVFVCPYVPRQARGFAIMQRTFARFGEATQTIIPPPTLPESPTHLQFLQRSLFASDSEGVPPPLDQTVSLEAYPHRHAEVAAIMARIRAYLASGQYGAGEIAIVSRQPTEFELLLQEQARLQELPTQLSLAPRMLLLTPLGRFALTLYEIRKSGDTRLSPDQFGAILASGWLGTLAQTTADIYETVRPQFFETCESLSEWRNSFDRLAGLESPSPGTRLPSALVTAAVLQRWRDSLETVDRLCQRLFSAQNATIGEHIRLLLDELAALDAEAIRASEREIINKIGDALREAAETSSSLRLSSDEFGEVLNSLVKEYAQEGDPGGTIPENEKVWIATPESLDSFVPPPDSDIRAKKVIFWLALDEQRVPRRAVEPWPLYKDNLNAVREIERYLFLATVRAAGERIHFSYSRSGEDAQYRPSVYLEEVKKVLSREIVSAGAAAMMTAPPSMGARPAPAIQRADYELNEIVQFGLCPYRYQLERLDSDARFCREPFQMQFQAQAEWLRKIYAAASGRRVRSMEDLAALFAQCLDQTESAVQLLFPALRPFHWQGVKDAVRRQLQYRSDSLPSGNYRLTIEPWPADSTRTLTVDGPQITVNCRGDFVVRRGVMLILLEDALLRREWTLAGQKPPNGSANRVEIDELELFRTPYDAQQWWKKALRRGLDGKAPANRIDPAETAQLELEIGQLIQSMETGRYPKNPGEHCQFCVMRRLCLGVPEANQP